jgi:alcohol dehydrogenase class IV
MLPYVMEYNLISNPGRFAEIARLMGESTDGLSGMEAAQKSVAAVRRLLDALGMPQNLSDVGLTEADIPDLVEELMALQTFPIGFMNPREVGPEDARELYYRAL